MLTNRPANKARDPDKIYVALLATGTGTVDDDTAVIAQDDDVILVDRSAIPALIETLRKFLKPEMGDGENA